MTWKTEIAKKEMYLFSTYRSKIRMNQMKDCCAVLLARNPRDFAASFLSINDFSSKKTKMQRIYVVPMRCEGRKDNVIAMTSGFDGERENCIIELGEDFEFERDARSFIFPFRMCWEGTTYHVAIGTVMELYNIRNIKEDVEAGKPVMVYCYHHQTPYYQAIFGNSVGYIFAD